jgi:hypothetical protein
MEVNVSPVTTGLTRKRQKNTDQWAQNVAKK